MYTEGNRSIFSLFIRVQASYQGSRFALGLTIPSTAGIVWSEHVGFRGSEIRDTGNLYDILIQSDCFWAF